MIKLRKSVLLFQFLLLTQLVYFGQSRTLEAVYCGNLPSSRAHTAAVFDGKHSVYVIGGFAGSLSWSDIYHFNVTSEGGDVIGQLPKERYAGVAGYEAARDEIFYLGGMETIGVVQNVSKFSIGDAIASDVALLPVTQAYAAGAVSPITGNIYSIGGFPSGVAGKKIFIYDPSRNIAVEAENELPVALTGAVSIWIDGAVYIFGGMMSDGTLSNLILEYSPSAKSITPVASLPFGLVSGTVVAHNSVAYLIGGSTDTGSVNHILKVNTKSWEIESLDVKGFPKAALVAHSSIFNVKTKRIYNFGGLSTYIHYEIFYIDVSEL